MPRLFAVVVAVAVVAAMPSSRAARDPSAVTPAIVAQELIVLEAPNCIYCSIFRRDVLPGYQKSKRVAELPIRFVDLNDPAFAQLKLTSSVDIVPTVVLMREGREADRISGYTGPEAFFHSVSRMLGTIGY